MLTYNKQYHPSGNSVAVTTGKIFFQPKLTINNPKDQYEREADTVADKVMKMETPFVQKKSGSDLFFSPSPISITPVQRKCAHCEEEEKMQRKEIKGTIQRQTTPPAEEFDIDVRRNPPGEKHDINDPPNLATFDLLDPLNSSVCYKGFCLPSTRSVINGLKKLKNSTGAKPVYNWPLPGLTKEQVRQAACKSIPSLCPPAAGTQTGILNLTLPPIQLDIPRFQFFDHRIIDHFIFNKYDVPFRHKSLLDKTATELAANPDLITNIIGHTDVHGGDEYNQALSENRAHVVEQYFLTANVPSSQIWTVNGMGKQQPRFTNDAVNAASASKNRRVELDIRKLIWNVSFTSAPSHTLQLQRKCAHCEEEEKLQRKEIDEEKTDADYNLENYVGGLSGAGQPLPNEVRNFYEPRFGYDFSNVKVHTNNVAAKSAQSINALAYTLGNNIVFNNGQYAPDTNTGKKLLAHELTHVVQQASYKSNIPGAVMRQAKPDNKFESCTTTQKSQLIPIIEDARKAVSLATSVIATSWGRPDKIAPNRKQLLLDHFHTASRGDLRDILSKYISLEKTFATGFELKCETTCPKDTKGVVCGYAYNTQWFGGRGPIHICFDSAGCDFTNTAKNNQVALIIHEAAHRHTGVDDKAYRWEAKYNTQSSDDAMDNADTYAWFATLL